MSVGGRAGPGRSGRSRGQVHVDFVVGIVLFLAAFALVSAMLLQVLAPYDDQATPVVADRAADRLADSLLVGNNDPGDLDDDCLDAFFLGGDGTGCSFDPADPLADRLGIDATYRVNVRLVANVSGDSEPELLCFNGGDVGTCGTGELVAGPPVPSGGLALSVDRRLVRVDGRPVTLEVRVW